MKYCSIRPYSHHLPIGLLEVEPLCIPWSSMVEAAAESLAKQFSISMVDKICAMEITFGVESQLSQVKTSIQARV